MSDASNFMMNDIRAVGWQNASDNQPRRSHTAALVGRKI